MVEHYYFDDLYKEMLRQVINYGTKQENKRTGTTVTAFHGMAVKWDMKYYPLLQLRKMFPKTGAAEVAWMLLGTTSTEFLNKYTSIWKQFEDDGMPGNINTAYGYRWRSAFKVDQIENIVNKLKEDPSSRQQVLMSWDPRIDNVIPNKNIPCPYTAVINIIGGKLNIHLTLRSNDIVVGLPYDFLMYTLLGNLFANELGVEPGILAYSIAHGHIYHEHLGTVDKVMNKETDCKRVKVGFTDTITSCRSNPELFVSNVAEDCISYAPCEWNPRPKVIL